MIEIKRKKIDPSKIPEVYKQKWSAEILDEGFVPLPKRLIRVLDRLFVGPSAMKELSVLLSIIDYRRPELSRSPSLQHLAMVSGLSTQDYKDKLAMLRDKGWLNFQGSDEHLEIDPQGVMKRILEESCET